MTFSHSSEPCLLLMSDSHHYRYQKSMADKSPAPIRRCPIKKELPTSPPLPDEPRRHCPFFIRPLGPSLDLISGTATHRQQSLAGIAGIHCPPRVCLLILCSSRPVPILPHHRRDILIARPPPSPVTQASLPAVASVKARRRPIHWAPVHRSSGLTFRWPEFWFLVLSSQHETYSTLALTEHTPFCTDHPTTAPVLPRGSRGYKP